MAEKKKSGISLQEGNLVVKNKKFKKSDIIVFGVCLFVALAIWLYATNAKLKNTTNMENHNPEIETTQAK